MPKTLLTIIFVGALCSTVSAQLADGWYQIQCNTKNGGLMAWKSFSGMFSMDYVHFVVLANPQVDYNAVNFYLQGTGNGYYKIISQLYGGTNYFAEAYPKTGKINLGSSIGYSQDQLWYLQDAGNGKYRILVNTVNMGWMAVEAFAKSTSVLLSNVDQNEVDQLWFFRKV